MRSPLIRSLQEENEKREAKKRNAALRLADRTVSAAKRASQRSSKRFSRLEEEFVARGIKRNSWRDSKRYEEMDGEEFDVGTWNRSNTTKSSNKRASKRFSRMG